MAELASLEGMRFGKLLVLRRGPSDRHGGAKWVVQCDCKSSPKEVSTSHLNSGGTTSCGCGRKPPPKAPPKWDGHVGDRFGAWTVVGAPILRTPRRGGRRRWCIPCRCECGREESPQASELRAGRSQRCLSCKSKTHGATVGGPAKRSREYRCWKAMRGRCHSECNASYPDYGGRGIRVCDEWRTRGGFERFLAHIGPAPSETHTVDRINTNGHYEPGNVRWATQKEQSRNRRDTRYLTAFGVTKCLADWADQLGMSWAALSRRLAGGSDLETLVSATRQDAA